MIPGCAYTPIIYVMVPDSVAMGRTNHLSSVQVNAIIATFSSRKLLCGYLISVPWFKYGLRAMKFAQNFMISNELRTLCPHIK